MLESTDDTSTTGGYCGQIRAGRWFLSASLLISGRCIWLVVWNIFSHSVGNNHPNWLIFFRGVETTNQISIQRNFTPGWDIPSYLAVQCTSKWDDRVETHVFPFVPIYIVFVLCHDFFLPIYNMPQSNTFITCWWFYSHANVNWWWVSIQDEAPKILKLRYNWLNSMVYGITN